jgi:hypothetical protein
MTDLYAEAKRRVHLNSLRKTETDPSPVFGRLWSMKSWGSAKNYRGARSLIFDKDKNPLGSSHGCQDLSAADAKPVIKYYDKNGVLLKESS